jgi:uncharacterized protein (DUF2126 family)
MQRLEVTANAAFEQRFEIRIANRPLALVPVEKGLFIAGLRYRRTNLSPSLHPGLAPQVPLHLDIIHAGQARRFTLGTNHFLFRPAGAAEAEPPGPPCKSVRQGELTCDLRIA